MMRKTIVPLVAAGAVLATGATTGHAAAPDGAAGPWADAVTAARQGARIDGRRVSPLRRVPATGVGVAERTATDGTFFSLGIGGSVVLRFDNPVCDGTGNDLRVEESTRGTYVPESAQVDVSPDGRTWTPAARSLQRTYELELPDGVQVRYVRLTDTTNAGGRRNLDGFDVDGVAALHPTGPCATATDGGDPTLSEPPAVNPENAQMGILGETAAGDRQPSADGVVQGVCASGRKIPIRLRVPRRLGTRLRSVTLTLTGGGAATPVRFSRGRYRSTLDLSGLKRARYTLVIRMVGRNGRRAVGTRRYRACTSGADYKKRHPSRPRR